MSPAGLTPATPRPPVDHRPYRPRTAARRPPEPTTPHARSHTPTSFARPARRSARSARSRSTPLRERGRRRDRRRPRGRPSGSRATSPAPIHISKSYLEQQIEAAVPDRDRPVVLYCAGGVRSLFAAQTLRRDGLHGRGLDVRRLPGLEDARACRGRCRRVLTAEQKQRYSRHLLIPEVGTEGQARLLDSKVLFIGAGGLGSPGRALPRRRRRRARSASSTSTSSTSRTSSARSSTRTDRVGEKKVDSARRTIQRPQPRREGRRPRGDARRRQRRADHRRLRRHPRRDRHVRDALHCSTTRRWPRASRSSTPASSGSRAS